ncbi:putative ATP-dependent endonuclease of the OLD family [Chryseobacterium arachidis]|uniref:Putative ATP-dependent endonuclease of the OLD family n=2 Tax=Chryseobacterium arachidis TaxID=1416778 RepID=A0A1M5I7Q9_9FLAO|nr:AAA family ATPase [Chryseobacterium arachidis]SHG24296.1 putative ATP-dependent endonuclease of the OLD family [Chryseobacterium arachidis]
MLTHKNPYISRVQIKNFRNFLDADVFLEQKQVIIGENNVGKTNFLRAIQLILDKEFSDSDRQLGEEDFHESIEDAMENGAEIEISLEIRNYEHNSKLVAQFADAVISDNPPTLKVTYRFAPERNEFGKIINYQYQIFKGNMEDKKFTHEDRSFINIYVIKALRDVERELKSNRNSPLYKLVKQYEISKEDLEKIAGDLKDAAGGLLELDEIVHIKEALTSRFANLSGLQTDNEITFRTFDMDTEKLLYSLQVYMGIEERPVSELSLGLANLLYISLMLLLLKDKTVIPVIKEEQFNELLTNEGGEILTKLYYRSEQDKYILTDEIAKEDSDLLYAFMDEHNYRHQPFTILAIEEPEAHLHPTLQRLIYREVLHTSNTSVIFTSHSTHLASITPLEYIVHIRKADFYSKAYSTNRLSLSEGEKNDIERYIDAKRGEIYFGKGIILVEGITEEYIIPAAAELMDEPLDNHGIVVCNINSTNFKPYIQLLQALDIPWVVCTDGDYYEVHEFEDEGVKVSKRVNHIMETEGSKKFGWAGNDNINKILHDLGIQPKENSDELELNDYGCFVGYYTLEVDMMENCGDSGMDIIKSIFRDLKSGGKKMQENFENRLDSGDFWGALARIESEISKGRFAQRLTSELTMKLVPKYVQDCIEEIIKKIKDSYE